MSYYTKYEEYVKLTNVINTEYRTINSKYKSDLLKLQSQYAEQRAIIKKQYVLDKYDYDNFTIRMKANDKYYKALFNRLTRVATAAKKSVSLQYPEKNELFANVYKTVMTMKYVFEVSFALDNYYDVPHHIYLISNDRTAYLLLKRYTKNAKLFIENEGHVTYIIITRIIDEL